MVNIIKLLLVGLILASCNNKQLEQLEKEQREQEKEGTIHWVDSGCGCNGTEGVDQTAHIVFINDHEMVAGYHNSRSEEYYIFHSPDCSLCANRIK